MDMSVDPAQTPMAHPTRPLTLFCCILDMSSRAFPVDILDSKTVGHLKEEIVKKNSNALANVDAGQLELWKVCDFLHFDLVILIA